MSELIFVISYVLLESGACWWYPWTVAKVVGVGMGSDDLMLENGLIVWRCFGSVLSWIQLIQSSRMLAQVVGSLVVARRQRTKKH